MSTWSSLRRLVNSFSCSCTPATFCLLLKVVDWQMGVHTAAMHCQAFTSKSVAVCGASAKQMYAMCGMMSKGKKSVETRTYVLQRSDCHGSQHGSVCVQLQALKGGAGVLHRVKQACGSRQYEELARLGTPDTELDKLTACRLRRD